MGHVIEPPNPVDAYSFSKSFGVHLLPDYGPVCSVKRPVRTRMRGVVGAGGEIPPATRLCERLKMPGIGIDLKFDCFEDPPHVFITWEGVQVIRIYEDPIYLGGEWEDESSWKIGPLAELIYGFAVSENLNFGRVAGAKAFRGIPHDNIAVPESVRIRLEGYDLPCELPPIRYEPGSR